MNYSIGNHLLSAEIRSEGAELGSLKKDGLEYVWEADPLHWGHSAPILFPIVGGLKEGRTKIEGTSYAMAKHGFLRGRAFSLTQQSKHSVTLSTQSDAGTLAQYPYPFRFSVTFALEESALITTYLVENPSSSPMDFTLGAHPAFRCPLQPETGEKFSDFDLTFPVAQTADCPHVSQDGVILTRHRRRMLEKEETLSLHQGLFYNDALIFDQLTCRSATLSSRKTGHGIRMDFDGFPFLGVWSPQSMTAPFVCLEPWLSMGVTEEEHTEEYLEKPGIQHLEGGRQASFSFTLNVF